VEEIRKATSAGVTTLVGDITTPSGKKAQAPRPEARHPREQRGGPPPGDFRNWTREDLAKASTRTCRRSS
jgi:3-oxoacyl-[acyl-carrier protein] reductase